jgi:DNA-3-methyladenine glycosylase I
MAKANNKLASRKQDVQRCPWPGDDDELMKAYHDREWGVPVRDDPKIFEFLVLEAFQAGLSWRTILHKRENFRRAFKGFDPRKIARFGAKDRARLLKDAGIVRNRAKIDATIGNAALFLKVREEFGSFSKYMWGWVGGKPIVHRPRTLEDYPTVIPEAEAWAKDLKERGFRFLGPTVIYAHMQAVGMVNDHTVDCFRH